MNDQLLKDPDVKITNELLKQALGDVSPVLMAFLKMLSSDELGMSYEWRYYKDAKAWLCKITRKKKTMVWLSVWNGFFRLGFYFTEKTGAEIDSLGISQSLKKSYETGKMIGRLKPLIVDVSNKDHLEDALTVLKYKSGIR